MRTKPAASSAASRAKLRRRSTSPATTLARHVPHTPPLQANGRSGRTRWAPSRIETSRRSDDRRAPAVEDDRHVARRRRRSPARRARPAAGRRPRRRTARGGRGRTGTPSSPSTCWASTTIPYGPHSHQWSTSATVEQRRQEQAQLGGVEAAAEQLRLAWLAGQHVDQLDPSGRPVLEVGELVGEHHRVGAPVAVQHRHA